MDTEWKSSIHWTWLLRSPILDLSNWFIKPLLTCSVCALSDWIQLFASLKCVVVIVGGVVGPVAILRLLAFNYNYIPTIVITCLRTHTVFLLLLLLLTLLHSLHRIVLHNTKTQLWGALHMYVYIDANGGETAGNGFWSIDRLFKRRRFIICFLGV